MKSKLKCVLAFLLAMALLVPDTSFLSVRAEQNSLTINGTEVNNHITWDGGNGFSFEADFYGNLTYQTYENEPKEDLADRNDQSIPSQANIGGGESADSTVMSDLPEGVSSEEALPEEASSEDTVSGNGLAELSNNSDDVPESISSETVFENPSALPDDVSSDFIAGTDEISEDIMPMSVDDGAVYIIYCWSTGGRFLGRYFVTNGISVGQTIHASEVVKPAFDHYAFKYSENDSIVVGKDIPAGDWCRYFTFYYEWDPYRYPDIDPARATIDVTWSGESTAQATADAYAKSSKLETIPLGSLNFSISYNGTKFNLTDVGMDITVHHERRFAEAENEEGVSILACSKKGSSTSYSYCTFAEGSNTVEGAYEIPSIANGLIFIASYAKFYGELPKLDENEILSQVRLGSFLWGGTEERDEEIRDSATRMLRSMTDVEKAGQLFIITYNNANDTQSIIENYNPGGFIMMGNAFSGRTPAQVSERIETLQGWSNIPLIISTDEEGGRVARVSGDGGTAFRSSRFLSPRQIWVKYDGDKDAAADYAGAQAEEMSELLLGLGINMNHAPVADTITTGRQIRKIGKYERYREPVFELAYMGSEDPYKARSWGATPYETGEFTSSSVSGMEGNGLGTTIKHFPSYGNSLTDGHGGVVIYSSTDYQLSELYEMMIPFADGVKAGGEAFMMTHNVYECFDPQNSMSMSAKMYGFVRNTMGFDGLCITDGLAMNGIVVDGETKGEALLSESNMAVSAITAGADMAIVSDTAPISAVIRLMSLDGDFKERVNDACFRVLCWKMSHGLLEYEESDNEDAVTVEYYATIPRIVQGAPDASQTSSVIVIDTDSGMYNGSGGVLPVNGELQPHSVSLEFEEDNLGHFKYEQTDVPLYAGVKVTLEELQDPETINKLTKLQGVFNFDSDVANYICSGILIITLPPGYNSFNEMGDDEFKELVEEGVIIEYEKWMAENYRFTTDKTLADADEHYIFISDNAIIRLMFLPTEGTQEKAVNFHDYDINSTDFNKGGTLKVSEGTMLTDHFGINSDGNYDKNNLPKLAFGNATNVNGVKYGDTEYLNGYYINRANPQSFGNCSFGLVKEHVTDGVIEFNVNAPNLFLDGDEKRIGRSDHDGKLVFNRVGDTYTLRTAYVEGELMCDELDTLNWTRSNWNKTLTLWSNEFWPMDNVWNYDIHYGGNTAKQKYSSSYGTRELPPSDYPVNGDHNPIFGMNFEVNFECVDNYIGPLEYYFFGDDDMWVYLTDKSTGESQLVCDIGGVHGSVGEYVNLWNWVPQGTSGSYKLSFYFTERGASGSTCWMQFTLPVISFVDAEVPDDVTLTTPATGGTGLWLFLLIGTALTGIMGYIIYNTKVRKIKAE